jgi:hypothetical protein
MRFGFVHKSAVHKYEGLFPDGTIDTKTEKADSSLGLDDTWVA